MDVNLIELLLSIPMAIITTFSYDYFRGLSRNRRFRKKYTDFVSAENKKRDWQHWNIVDGKLSDQPIPSFMNIHHGKEMILVFNWANREDGGFIGKGIISMIDEVRGKLYFYEHGTLNYSSRECFFTKLRHKGGYYHAILINAQDEGNNKYAMMRKVAEIGQHTGRLSRISEEISYEYKGFYY